MDPRSSVAIQNTKVVPTFAYTAIVASIASEASVDNVAVTLFLASVRSAALAFDILPMLPVEPSMAFDRMDIAEQLVVEADGIIAVSFLDQELLVEYSS